MVKAKFSPSNIYQFLEVYLSQSISYDLVNIMQMLCNICKFMPNVHAVKTIFISGNHWLYITANK